jgi:CBS domain-containing protein
MSTIREHLNQDRILDLGPLPAPRLPAEATLQQTVQFLVRGRRGAVVVVDGLRPIGIFSDRDVLYRVSDEALESREARTRVSLRDLMSAPPITVRRQETLAAGIAIMVEKGLRHLIVVDAGGDLRGLLTSNDLVQFFTDQYPEDTVNLPPHLHQIYRTPEGG